MFCYRQERGYLFTTEDIGFITRSKVLNSVSDSRISDYQKVLEVARTLGVEIEFNLMLLFDFIILNRDRHFNNFGIIIDNDTRSVKGFMPLFDHGNSLGNFMIDVDEIQGAENQVGSFNNTTLLAQGRYVYNNYREAKTLVKEILLGLDKLDTLNIPKDRIKIAKAIVKYTTSLSED